MTPYCSDWHLGASGRLLGITKRGRCAACIPASNTKPPSAVHRGANTTHNPLLLKSSAPLGQQQEAAIPPEAPSSSQSRCPPPKARRTRKQLAPLPRTRGCPAGWTHRLSNALTAGGSTPPRTTRGDIGTRPPPQHTHKDRWSKSPERKPRRGTDHLERPYQRPARGPCEVRAQRWQGGGGQTPRQRKRTNTPQTRSAHSNGSRTEPQERTDHLEWCTSSWGKGTSKPHAPQGA